MTLKVRPEDANGDDTIGVPFLIDSAAAVGQCIRTRLKLWRGEFFVDVTDGTPYPAQALGERYGKNPDGAIKQRILGTFGVKSIASYSSSFDGTTRLLTVNAIVNTIFGPVAVNEVI